MNTVFSMRNRRLLTNVARNLLWLSAAWCLFYTKQCFGLPVQLIEEKIFESLALHSRMLLEGVLFFKGGLSCRSMDCGRSLDLCVTF